MGAEAGCLFWSTTATVAVVMDQLDVVEQTTSGFQNNCLWFSTVGRTLRP